PAEAIVLPPPNGRQPAHEAVEAVTMPYDLERARCEQLAQGLERIPLTHVSGIVRCRGGRHADQREAARLQNTAKLAGRSAIVLDVLEHLRAQDPVDRGVLERQVGYRAQGVRVPRIRPTTADLGQRDVHVDDLRRLREGLQESAVEALAGARI